MLQSHSPHHTPLFKYLHSYSINTYTRLFETCLYCWAHILNLILYPLIFIDLIIGVGPCSPVLALLLNNFLLLRVLRTKGQNFMVGFHFNLKLYFALGERCNIRKLQTLSHTLSVPSTASQYLFMLFTPHLRMQAWILHSY